MQITTAEFIMSNTEVSKCPTDNKPEYAFIGRSNVGKSSLINMLTNKKKLAKISSQPGKTQHINHFLINNEWYLVDLPGYGFAKVSKKLQENWYKFIDSYILNRTNLICLFVLLDSRIAPQTIDLEFMQKLGKNQIPFVMVFTKADKLTPKKQQENLTAYKEKMSETWEYLPEIFVTSSEKRIGGDEILNFINKTNKSLK